MSEKGIAPGLLLAMPQLDDPNFERAVVLMVEHTEQGSFGLIMNRPTDVEVAEVMQSMGVEWLGDPDALVWSGGPVMPRTGWLLHEPTGAPPGPGTVCVAPGIELSTSPQQLQALAGDPPEKLRFLMGYSGWGSTQLEGELAAGSWLWAESRPDLIFDTAAERMWQTVLHSLGVEPATLVQGSGVH